MDTTAESTAVDQVFAEIGEFGVFQKINLFLLCLPSLMAGTFMVNYVFAANTLDYRSVAMQSAFWTSEWIEKWLLSNFFGIQRLAFYLVYLDVLCILHSDPFVVHKCVGCETNIKFFLYLQNNENNNNIVGYYELAPKCEKISDSYILEVWYFNDLSRMSVSPIYLLTWNRTNAFGV